MTYAPVLKKISFWTRKGTKTVHMNASYTHSGAPPKYKQVPSVQVGIIAPWLCTAASGFTARPPFIDHSFKKSPCSFILTLVLSCLWSGKFCLHSLMSSYSPVAPWEGAGALGFTWLCNSYCKLPVPPSQGHSIWTRPMWRRHLHMEGQLMPWIVGLFQT